MADVQHLPVTTQLASGKWRVACTCRWATRAQFATRQLALSAHALHKQQEGVR